MNTFISKFEGSLVGLLQWSDWEAMKAVLSQTQNAGWYVYFVGHEVPSAPVSADHFVHFLNEIDYLLHKDHEEPYLGIVYADDPNNPEFITIYDPNNLGSTCGWIGYRVLPGWILSRVLPLDLQVKVPLPNNRKRWWQHVFSR